MKSLKPLVLPALALLLGSSGTAAQSIYRCGNSYSQTPCANAVLVEADDPRSAEQRSAAQEGLARDKALAKELETTRLREEALALERDREALARAAAAHHRQDKKPEHKSLAAKRAASSRLRTVRVQNTAPDNDIFTATVDASSPKKKGGKTRKP